MRSCFPEYKAPTNRKKSIGVYQADELPDVRGHHVDPEDDNDFKDVEAFLSGYQSTPEDLGDLGRFTEEEAAEALAELKKKTRCRRCNKLGHWARECKAPPTDKATSSSSSSGAPTGAGYVQVVITLDLRVWWK